MRSLPGATSDLARIGKKEYLAEDRLEKRRFR